MTGRALASDVNRPSDVSGWFEALFAKHLEFVVRSLLRLGVAPRDVEDLAQQVFVIAYEKNVGASEPDVVTRGWLWGVARRTAADYRALARHRIELDGGEAMAKQRDRDDLAERVSARQLVHRALDRLPDDRREALILYEMEGFTLAEIAQLVGLPLQTIASRVRKARVEFAEAVLSIQKATP